MQVRILGAAAGGGFPQWNCHCPGCQRVRAGHPGVHARTQSSLAIRGSSGPWFLVNASPDIRQQLEQLHYPPFSAVRASPIAGVLLTDAEIDHSAGLLILRESPEPLLVYSTDTVRQALTDGLPLLRVLRDYCGVTWSDLKLDRSLNLGNHEDTGLMVEAFPLGTKPPKYMGSASPAQGAWVVGLTFRDSSSGGVLTYAPGIGAWSPPLLERLAASDCILVDGTCWQDDELSALGISTRTARAMGHLPLAGAEGSLARLATLSRPRKILVHINNTNPVLLADSAARQAVEAAGVEIGYDGLIVEL